MRVLLVVLLLLILAPLAAQAQTATPTPYPQYVAADQLVQMLVTGDYTDAYAQFDDTMTALVTQDQLQQAWEKIIANAGAFQQVLITREDVSGEAVVVSLQFQSIVLDAVVAFDSAGKVSGLRFRSAPSAAATATLAAPTPVYANPSAFTETDVTVGQYKLPGKITMPTGSGPFPAVVLIAGSGPTDMNETIGPNEPFRDIAWGLAAQGIATLRFDKRTLAAASSLDMAHLTVKDEYVDDSVAAVELLRQTSGIDPARVFVLGHSEGGYVLPRIGAADPNIAGLIIASGLATPLPEKILEQTRYIQSLGTPSPSDQAALSTIQSMIDQINALTPDTTSTALLLGAPPSYWLDLKDYDPVALAATLPQPILVLQGGRDYQVTLSEDFARWQAGLANHPDTTFKTYPDLNHIYVTGTGMSTPDEYNQPGNVAPQVIDDIAAWVKAH